MNTKQLEFQAKALAPVIKEFVDIAISKAREELNIEYKNLISKLAEDFDIKHTEIEKKIPYQIDKSALIDEFKALIPEVDLSGLLTATDVGLIVEERAVELKAFLEKSIESIPIPKDGQSVTIDDVLPIIEEKITAKIAEIPTPKDGNNGIDGLNGRDALNIEILPSVDMTKTYPRGTYAMMHGGVIRSYQQTQGEKGWETAWNGIASIDTTMKDARTVSVVSVLTDGTRNEKTFSLPTMIYRGVFKEGDYYLHGDVATFGGSLWHCDKETKEKPGTCNDWTLAAKKGRDGK